MSSHSVKLAKALRVLQNIKDIQGPKGNYDYDPYMHGMFNGIELAMSVMENREPRYKEAPKTWGKDVTYHGTTTTAHNTVKDIKELI